MAASYYVFGGTLSATRLIAKSFLAPWSPWSASVIFTAADAMSSAVSAAVRVINGVHNDASDRWPLAFVAHSAGFAVFDILVLFIANSA